jgi:ubiquinone/menaquinone biosynthesis C-methylase UbiE
MKQNTATLYLSPITKEELALNVEQAVEDEVITGTFATASGQRYPIVSGIPYLVTEVPETPDVKLNREYYAQVGTVYDEGMNWLFSSFYEDEQALRRKMVDLLEINSASRVLEIGAGTCRDSAEIISRLGPTGQMFISDLSPEMLTAGRVRIENVIAAKQVEFLVCDAAFLPFPDNYFDAIYHFGGLNLFGDQAASFQEFTRVVKVGGKVVVGDEGLPPWLHSTTFGKILTNSNPLYRHEPPLKLLPIEAREVCVQWLLGNAFYLIDYRVGEGEPALNLDLPIPGKRRGTHRTRYYGILEGVDPELKAEIIQIAQSSGLSVAEWLDKTLRDSISTLSSS